VGALRLASPIHLTTKDPETTMLLLASAAVSKDIGLLATFIGIGVIVNVIVVLIAIQIRGERQQNQQRR
jgi:hypothetical protein